MTFVGGYRVVVSLLYDGGARSLFDASRSQQLPTTLLPTASVVPQNTLLALQYYLLSKADKTEKLEFIPIHRLLQ